MRLLAFSDIHLDAVTAGRARREEVQRFLTKTRRIAEQEAVDLVIFAGDAHDPGSLLDPLHTAVLIENLFAFVRLPQKPQFVAIPGNHDVVDVSTLFIGEPVTTLSPLLAAQMACQSTDGETVRTHIMQRPRAIVLDDQYVVLALPYLSRVHAKTGPAWLEAALQQALTWSLEGKKIIVVGHMVIPGAQMGSESMEMAKGQDQLFPLEAVAKLNPVITINGHYHARQFIRHDSLTIVIPGAPVRFTFGEQTQIAKGVVIAEV